LLVSIHAGRWCM